MSRKLCAVASLLGALGCAPLQAAETVRNFDLGDLSNTNVTFPVFTPGLGDFRDFISFSVTGSGAGFGGAANFVVDDTTVDGVETNFDILSVSLLDSSDTTLASDTDGSDGFSVFATLPTAGVYRFSVQGTANGTVNGAYQGFLQTEVAAVPEPETYVLLLAGLGAVAALRRNRKA